MKTKNIWYVLVLLFVASSAFAVTVQPGSLDFGTFQQGTPKKGFFVISNTPGTQAFTFTASSDSPAFQVGLASGSVPPGGALKIEVSVIASGTQRGNLNGTILIKGTGLQRFSASVPVKATVVSLKSTAQLLDFGKVNQGTEKTLKYQVQNDSSITGVFQLSRDPEFFVPSNPVVFGLGSNTMTLTLPANAAPGSYSGSVLIIEEGKPGNILSIPIKAIVVAVSQ